MRVMAAIAANDPALAATLRAGRVDDILRRASANAEFHAAYRAYLERFGDRCLDELKLESATLSDDPLPLLPQLLP